MFNAPVGSSRSFEFGYDAVRLPPDIELSDFSGVAHISRTRQGLLVDGDFKGQVDAQCIRCLGPAHNQLQTQFQELYVFKGFPPTDSELVVPDDGYIDLGPVVGEYLILEIPITTLCREDCRGLCSICGINLNENPEHVHEMEEE